MSGDFGQDDAESGQSGVTSEDEFERRHVFVLQKFEKLHELEKSYTTLVVSAGYAALLTIWHGAGSIPTACHLILGAIIGFSIFVFVTFEMLKLSVSVGSGARFNDAVEYIRKNDFDVIFRAAQVSAYEKTSKVNRYQPVAFAWSLGTASLAAVLLISNMVSTAIFHTGWPK